MPDPKRELPIPSIPSTPSTSPSILTVATLPEAFAAVEAEILAVPLEALVPISVDIPTVTRAVMGAIEELAKLLPDLAQLPDYDLRKVTHLQLYAGAALHAHRVAPVVDPMCLRARAFTLFAEAHDESLCGVAFLRWHEGDWDTFVPWSGKRQPEELMSEAAWAKVCERTKYWIDGEEVLTH